MGVAPPEVVNVFVCKFIVKVVPFSQRVPKDAANVAAQSNRIFDLLDTGRSELKFPAIYVGIEAFPGLPFREVGLAKLAEDIQRRRCDFHTDRC
jgi:hypothetical protein